MKKLFDNKLMHSTAQHSTAQHSTAQHSTAQQDVLCLFASSISKKLKYSSPLSFNFSSPKIEVSLFKTPMREVYNPRTLAFLFCVNTFKIEIKSQ